MLRVPARSQFPLRLIQDIGLRLLHHFKIGGISFRGRGIPGHDDIGRRRGSVLGRRRQNAAHQTGRQQGKLEFHGDPFESCCCNFQVAIAICFCICASLCPGESGVPCPPPLEAPELSGRKISSKDRTSAK